MINKNKEIVEAVKMIHASNLYGVIIECGNGCSITSALMQIEGASNTIYESKQPYNKDVQKTYYTGQYDRSVSLNFIKDVLKTEKEKNSTLFSMSDKKPFILASSFQLRSTDSKQNILTHGWIGLHIDGEDRYYHLSIPESKVRTSYFAIIAKCALDLFIHIINPKSGVLVCEYLDQVILPNEPSLVSTLKYTIYNKKCKKNDFFITINKKNEVIRFEDLVRNKKGVILQKGSYNPIHEGHEEIMKLTTTEYPTYASSFLISIVRYDKPMIALDDLLDRIQMITELGYNVIITKNPLFKDSLYWLRSQTRYRQLPVVFPMGIDTINRVIDTDIDERQKLSVINIDWSKHFSFLQSTVYKNTTFFVFNRQGYDLKRESEYFKNIVINPDYTDPNAISSTKIRNQYGKENIY